LNGLLHLLHKVKELDVHRLQSWRKAARFSVAA
jgi:hypothetical protein